MKHQSDSNTTEKESPVFETYIYGMTIEPYSAKLGTPERGHGFFEVIAQLGDDGSPSSYQSQTFRTSREAIECAYEWERTYKYAWNIKVVEHVSFSAEIEW